MTPSPPVPAPPERERPLIEAFVRLADTLVDDYDVIELFERLCSDCVALLRADAAGLVLTDQRGALQAVSASTEVAALLERFQIDTDQGPCLESFRSSALVRAPDLAGDPRWPAFGGRAVASGFRAVHALPMRWRGSTIGALNLFHHAPTAMPAGDLAVGQALADVATIGILSDRASRERDLLTEQLQAALTSRVVIEQAKGVLAERGGIGMDEAFGRLRTYARSTSTRLSDVARSVVEGTLDTATMTPSEGTA
jgi:GAF domain-containing protein